MRAKYSYAVFVMFAVLLLAVPFAYNREQRNRTRNFRVVTPDVLYRCGQLNQAGLEKIIHDYGIRTVITFRKQDGIHEKNSTWEKDFCQAKGITFVRIPLRERDRDPGDGALTPQERARLFAEAVGASVDEFVNVVKAEGEHPRPILMHCFAGLHRTGAFGAIYRMEFERWTNTEAVEEMEAHGYDDLTPDIRWFLETYQPRWKRTGGGPGGYGP